MNLILSVIVSLITTVLATTPSLSNTGQTLITDLLTSTIQLEAQNRGVCDVSSEGVLLCAGQERELL